ncbi:PHD finger protein, putative [Babesia caballi]|uniref:PHD finger protein, putative n=1 Tax=Babesia caballi TaxID=5871 RepID=A0AAV4LRS9_BABCB|nr:PHD finger protein, putative [Babesia caballi]
MINFKEGPLPPSSELGCSFEEFLLAQYETTYPERRLPCVVCKKMATSAYSYNGRSIDCHGTCLTFALFYYFMHQYDVLSFGRSGNLMNQPSLAKLYEMPFALQSMAEYKKRCVFCGARNAYFKCASENCFNHFHLNCNTNSIVVVHHGKADTKQPSYRFLFCQAHMNNYEVDLVKCRFNSKISLMQEYEFLKSGRLRQRKAPPEPEQAPAATSPVSVTGPYRVTMKGRPNSKQDRSDRKPSANRGSSAIRKIDEFLVPGYAADQAITAQTGGFLSPLSERGGHARDYIACLCNEYGVLKRQGYQKNTKRFEWWPYEILFTKIGTDLFSNATPLSSLADLYKDLRSVLVFDRCVDSLSDLRKLAMESEPCIINVSNSIAMQTKQVTTSTPTNANSSERPNLVTEYIPFVNSSEDKQDSSRPESDSKKEPSEGAQTPSGPPSERRRGQPQDYYELVGRGTHRPTFVLARYGNKAVWLSTVYVRSQKTNNTKMGVAVHVHLPDAAEGGAGAPGAAGDQDRGQAAGGYDGQGGGLQLGLGADGGGVFEKQAGDLAGHVGAGAGAQREHLGGHHRRSHHRLERAVPGHALRNCALLRHQAGQRARGGAEGGEQRNREAQGGAASQADRGKRLCAADSRGPGDGGAAHENGFQDEQVVALQALDDAGDGDLQQPAALRVVDQQRAVPGGQAEGGRDQGHDGQGVLLGVPAVGAGAQAPDAPVQPVFHPRALQVLRHLQGERGRPKQRGAQDGRGGERLVLRAVRVRGADERQHQDGDVQQRGVLRVLQQRRGVQARAGAHEAELGDAAGQVDSPALRDAADARGDLPGLGGAEQVGADARGIHQRGQVRDLHCQRGCHGALRGAGVQRQVPHHLRLGGRVVRQRVTAAQRNWPAGHGAGLGHEQRALPGDGAEDAVHKAHHGALLGEGRASTHEEALLRVHALPAQPRELPQGQPGPAAAHAAAEAVPEPHCGHADGGHAVDSGREGGGEGGGGKGGGFRVRDGAEAAEGAADSAAGAGDGAGQPAADDDGAAPPQHGDDEPGARDGDELPAGGGVQRGGGDAGQRRAAHVRERGAGHAQPRAPPDGHERGAPDDDEHRAAHADEPATAADAQRAARHDAGGHAQARHDAARLRHAAAVRQRAAALRGQRDRVALLRQQLRAADGAPGHELDGGAGAAGHDAVHGPRQRGAHEPDGGAARPAPAVPPQRVRAARADGSQVLEPAGEPNAVPGPAAAGQPVHRHGLHGALSGAAAGRPRVARRGCRGLAPNLVRIKCTKHTHSGSGVARAGLRLAGRGDGGTHARNRGDFRRTGGGVCAGRSSPPV